MFEIALSRRCPGGIIVSGGGRCIFADVGTDILLGLCCCRCCRCRYDAMLLYFNDMDQPSRLHNVQSLSDRTERWETCQRCQEMQ